MLKQIINEVLRSCIPTKSHHNQEFDGDLYFYRRNAAEECSQEGVLCHMVSEQH